MPILSVDADPVKSLFTSEIANRDNIRATVPAIKRILDEIEDDDIKLNVTDINVDESAMPNTDIRKQKEVKSKLGTWANPVRISADLVNKHTGEVVDSVKNMKVADIPKVTDRNTYMIGGNEYQFTKQLRLKPGVYTRRRGSGEISSFINADKTIDFERGFNRDFKINFEPDTKLFKMNYANRTVPLISALRISGANDDELKKMWGSEIFEANAKRYRNLENDTKTMYNAVFGKRPDSSLSQDQMRKDIRNRLETTGLNPDVTSQTLGKPFDRVTPEVLSLASKKIVDINKGVVEPDDREALIFKSVHDADSLIKDNLLKSGKKIASGSKWKLKKANKIRAGLSSDSFKPYISGSITSSKLSNPPSQQNVLSILGEGTKTTVTGEGGIGSSNAITEDIRQISNTEAGYIDPLHTPEGGAIGVSNHLALGAMKIGDRLFAPHRTMDGKVHMISPDERYDKYTSFADEFDLSGDRPKPKSKEVTALHRNDIVKVPASKVDYIIHSPQAMFDSAVNLIPFNHSIQANRGLTASKMQEQAVSLKHRENPLFDIVTPTGKSLSSEIMQVIGIPHSPVSGEVTSISDDSIKIKDIAGKSHEIQLYNNFSLNSESFLHNEPLVKIGDSVKKGQVLADNNFTKNGKYALGTNLDIAYTPWKGYSFEDSAVMSRSAADKLTSMHMYDIKDKRTPKGVFSKSKFKAYYPEELKAANAAKLDKDGVVKPGQIVEPGDVVIAHLERQEATADDIAVGRLDKQLKRDMANKAQVWDKPFRGVVTGVEKPGSNVVVNIRTEEPLKEADKIVGLHGNKHIISKILPDEEMPFNPRTGKHVDITMSPIGVSNRINTSQIFEAEAGKIAQATGKPYKIQNFDGHDTARKILKELKDLGLSDKETLINPDTGKALKEQIATGVAHIIKQEHKVDHKFSARYRDGHDAYEQASSGGETGGKNLGRMEIGAMLARGAYHNLREMYDIKGQKNDEWWRALETGQTPPPVKNAYVWDKLLADMRGAGVNVEQEGKTLTLKPLTDKDVEQITAGKLARPTETYRKKNFEPVRGGLFDPSLTGGMRGERFTHIELPEKILNPITKNATASLVGISRPELDNVIHGKKFVDTKTGAIVVPGTTGAVSGGPAIENLLSRVDLNKIESNAKQVTKTSKNPVDLNKAHKQLRYVKALRENNMKPTDYMVSKIPVTPPKFRPIFQMGGGESVVISDENELYQSLAQTSEAMKDLKKSMHNAGMKGDIENIQLAEVRGQLHDELAALQGVGDPTSFLHNIKNKKGFIRQIDGDEKQTKHGFFQKKLMTRRQDLVGRSTITLDPNIDSDHIGIPKEMATKIFQPFIVQELVGMGYTPLDAKEQIEKGTKVFQQARQNVADKRLVIANRAPTLHKYNMSAFKPILTDKKSIDVSGNVISGLFGGDFDGDTFQIHVPITTKAIKEAEQMLPSRNMLKAGYSTVLNAPAMDAVAGTWLASRGMGGTERKDVKNIFELESKTQSGDVSLADSVIINNKKAPAIMHLANKGLKPTEQMWDIELNKGNVHKWIKGVSERNKGGADGLRLADRLRNLGNQYTSDHGITLGVSDIVVDRNLRDKALHMAKELEKTEGVVPAYAKATEFLKKELIKKHKTDDIGIVLQSGAGKGIGNTSQILSMPGILMDAQDRPIPVPITRSYSEGLKSSDYWATTHGARGGNIKKSVQSYKPGHMTKDLISSLYETRIASEHPIDDEGLEYDPKEVNAVKNRFLARDVRDKKSKLIAKKNELINDDTLNKFRSHNIDRVSVQSPLTDPTPGDGFSAYSYGLDLNDKPLHRGDNIGIMSAHTVTEPSLNLAMKSFHTGGAFTGKGGDERYDLGTSFDAMDRILRFVKSPPDKATLAGISGTIENVKQSPAGGFDVDIRDKDYKETFYVGHGNKPVVKKGDKVRKGQLISQGTPNPHEFLELNGLRETQKYLMDSISKINEHKLDKRDIETIVRGITNTSKVEDPGDSGYTPGDNIPHTTAEWMNKELKKKGLKPIKHKPFLTPLGIGGKPTISEDWLNRFTHSRLKDVFMEGAAQGWKTDIRKDEGSPLPDLMVTSI